MEFYISRSVSGESGLLSIIGRRGSEPIHPGAEFCTILKEKSRQYPDGLEMAREIEACKNIRLIVREIEAYDRKVEFLPANTTGVLRCVGYSIDLAPGGWILTDGRVTATTPGERSSNIEAVRQ